MKTETEALKQAADELADAFELRKRPSSGEEFYTLKDGSPQWMTDAVREAHEGGEVLPNDWIYDRCDTAASRLTEYDPESWDDAANEIADGMVNIYNHDRARWLASHLHFGELVDEAAEEFGHDGGIYEAIGRGQYVLAYRIVLTLIEAIRDRASEIESDD